MLRLRLEAGVEVVRKRRPQKPNLHSYQDADVDRLCEAMGALIMFNEASLHMLAGRHAL